jgi:hypothetical protein
VDLVGRGLGSEVDGGGVLENDETAAGGLGVDGDGAVSEDGAAGRVVMVAR